jgi:hypothetical protein
LKIVLQEFDMPNCLQFFAPFINSARTRIESSSAHNLAQIGNGIAQVMSTSVAQVTASPSVTMLAKFPQLMISLFMMLHIDTKGYEKLLHFALALASGGEGTTAAVQYAQDQVCQQLSKETLCLIAFYFSISYACFWSVASILCLFGTTTTTVAANANNPAVGQDIELDHLPPPAAPAPH